MSAVSTYAAALQFIPLVVDVFDDVKAAEGGKAIAETVPLSINGVQGDLNVSWAPRSAGGKATLPTEI